MMTKKLERSTSTLILATLVSIFLPQLSHAIDLTGQWIEDKEKDQVFRTNHPDLTKDAESRLLFEEQMGCFSTELLVSENVIITRHPETKCKVNGKETTIYSFESETDYRILHTGKRRLTKVI